MILKTALILLYLVIGLWLFVSTITKMGGLSAIPEYNKKLIFSLSALIVMVFWPVLIIQGLVRRR